MREFGTIVDGKYLMEGPIGKGGMASVWKAVQIELDQPVAVKMIHTTPGRQDEQAERFLTEARVAASVRHRNVVAIKDFGRFTDGQPYMVMELLKGENLGQRMMRAPPLTHGEAMNIAAGALRGLAAVHEAGIVHRDIKPENIFLVEDADGTYPKLLDFGLSRHEGTIDVVDGTRQIAGTPEYMSPEQARGADLDERSDVFSMGVVLYELLSGTLPHNADRLDRLLREVIHTTPRPLAKLRPEVGAPIGELVACALEKDREDRFLSAREMRRALVAAAQATADADPKWARIRVPAVHVTRRVALSDIPSDVVISTGYRPGADTFVIERASLRRRRARRWIAGALLLSACIVGGAVAYEAGWLETIVGPGSPPVTAADPPRSVAAPLEPDEPTSPPPEEDLETQTEDVEAQAEDVGAQTEDVEAQAENVEAQTEDVEAQAEDVEAPAEDVEATAPEPEPAARRRRARRPRMAPVRVQMTLLSDPGY